jgi:hypothetical protein
VASATAGLSGGDGASAIPDCSGTVLMAGRDYLRYIGRTLEVHACITSAREPLRIVARDAETGEVVDRASLKAADYAAFQRGSRLHHTLRDAIEPLGPDDLVDAAIWLAVETRDLPDRRAQREQPGVGAWVHQVREDRMRASVLELAAALGGLAGAVVRANLDASQIGIPSVFARVPKRHLPAVGTLPGVNLVMPGSPDEELVPLQTQSINYFDSNVAWVHHFLGHTGNGITVAIHEGPRPDSYWNLPGIVPGDCEAPGGSAHCHCSNGTMHGHPRGVAGLVRNSVTPFGGIAPGATTIFANTGGCTTHGLDQFASAVNWATDEGASVINVSAVVGEFANMFWDYKAANWPFPTIVAAAGNAPSSPVGNRLRNGLVVGASTDNHLDYAVDSRHDIEWRPMSWINPEGWGELPHLVAPGSSVASAGFSPGEIANGLGTSASTPQVAAAAACMQDLNGTLKVRPHVLASGLMVGADINADAAEGGVWPLNLHDGMDHRDGTGQMNMYYSGWALLNEKKHTDPPSFAGYASGIMFESEYPPFYCHWHLWNVEVPAGHTLRAHSIFPSAPNCEGNRIGDSLNPGCLGNPYPETALFLVDELLNFLAGSLRTEQNWQYLSWHNTASTDEDLRLAVCIVDWNGLASSEFALSWFALEPLATPVP